jgi:hypothetical protein
MILDLKEMNIFGQSMKIKHVIWGMNELTHEEKMAQSEVEIKSYKMKMDKVKKEKWDREAEEQRNALKEAN